MMFAVVDTNTSNLRSVCNAFRRVGAETTVATRPEDLEGANAIVLPGVGSFSVAMRALQTAGLAQAVRSRVADEGVPLLGICLGMQLLADTSEEHGEHEGLRLIPGKVLRLRPTDTGFRVPNIGWYACHALREGVLFSRKLGPGAFYFVHSYALTCKDEADVAATIDYGGQAVTAAVERGNVFGCQFHPEKSQDAGLNLLSHFVKYVNGA